MPDLHSYIAFSKLRKLTEGLNELEPTSHVALQYELRRFALPFFRRRNGEFVEFNVRVENDARRTTKMLLEPMPFTMKVLHDGLVGTDYAYAGLLLDRAVPVAHLVAADPSSRSRSGSNLVITVREQAECSRHRWHNGQCSRRAPHHRQCRPLTD